MLEILKRLFSKPDASGLYFKPDEWKHFLAWREENRNLLSMFPSTRFINYILKVFNDGTVKVERLDGAAFFGRFGFGIFAREYKAWRPHYERDRLERDMIIHDCLRTEGEQADQEAIKFCNDYLATKGGPLRPLEQWRLNQLKEFGERYAQVKRTTRHLRISPIQHLRKEDVERIREEWERLHNGAKDSASVYFSLCSGACRTDDRHQPKAVIYDEMEETTR